MSKSSWKTVVYLVGAVIGILVGLSAAHLYAQSFEANRLPGEAPKALPKLEITDALRLGISVVALVRQISDLGARTS